MGNTFPITEEQVRERAYLIWIDNGRLDGTAEQNWHDAVCQLEEQSAMAESITDVQREEHERPRTMSVGRS